MSQLPKDLRRLWLKGDRLSREKRTIANRAADRVNRDTAEPEELWERAREIPASAIPTRGKRFYSIVMGIYKKMANYRPGPK